MFKYFKLCILLLPLLASGPVWSQWDSLFNIKNRQGKLELEYSSQEKKIKWSFKKGNFGKTRSRGPHQLSDQNFLEYQDQLLSDLRDLKVDPETINSYLFKLEEIRYTIYNSCLNIPINEVTASGDGNINPLIGELSKIEQKFSEQSEIYRSQKIKEIEVPGGIKIVIRAETDKTGELKNISVFTVPSDADIDIQKIQAGYLIKDKQKRNLLSFTVKKIDNRPLISFNQNLLNSHWIDFKHELVELVVDQSRLKTVPVSNDQVSNDAQSDGVSLTTNEASHFPVKKINNDGDYIPLADKRSMDEKTGKLFSPESQAFIFEKSSIAFERCMQFFVLQRSAGLLSIHDEELKNYCEDVSIWGVAEKEMIKILQIEDLATDDKDVSQKFSLQLRSDLNACLTKNSIIGAEGVFSYQKPEKNYEQKSEECYRGLLTGILKTKVHHDLENISLLHDPQGELKKALTADVLKRGFEECLSGKSVDQLKLCMVRVHNVQEASLFFTEMTLGLLDVSNNKSDKKQQISNDYKKCEAQIYQKIETESYLPELKKCAYAAIHSFDLLYLSDHMRDMAKKINTLDKSAIQESWLEEDRKKLGLCLNETFSSVESFSELRESQETKRFACRLSILKSHIPSMYISNYQKFSSSLLSSPEDVKQMEEMFSKSLELNLEKVGNLADLNGLLEKQHPVLVSLVVQKFYEDRCQHFKATCDNNKELDQKLKLLIGNGTNRPFKSAILKYFIELSGKVDSRGLEIHATDLARSISFELASQKTSKDSLDAYQACLERYRLNKDEEFSNHYLRCDKELYATKLFAEEKKKLESIVSETLPLTTNDANLVLTPATYLKECLQSLDLDNKLSFEDYEKKVKGCGTMALFEVQSNLTEYRIKSMKPLFKAQDHERIEKMHRQCMQNALVNVEKEIHITLNPDQKSPGYFERSPSQIYQALIKRSSGQISLLSLLDPSLNFDYNYRYGDQIVMKRFFDQIFNSDKFDEEKFQQSVDKCLADTNESVFNSFREFIISKVPVMYPQTQDKKAQDEIMRSFLDYELLDLILKYTKMHSGAFDTRAKNAPLEQRLVTPEFSLNSLSNFIGLVGDYLGKGFFFDPKQMKTELVVFQGELKDFFGWALSQTDQPTVAELGEFFKTSKIADHLAIAAVSENVRGHFHNFIDQMRNDELTLFLKSKGKANSSQLSQADRSEYQRIESKYAELDSLSVRMTSSYDFRRIIRPQGQKGEKLIEEIKKGLLMPKVLGAKPRQQDVDNIQKQLADFILADNTDGGFTERFVASMAQHYLDQDSKSHWAITKWLFYDNGDFNWNKIRNTKSGREAIDYFGRNILLPKILGQKLSPETEKLRKSRFQKLITKAQDENNS